jgi:hypothetical protein
MASYPKSVTVNEDQLTALTDTYQKAYLQIYSEIAGATNFGQVRRKQILARIEAILQELGTNTTDFIQKNLPEYYKTGADEAVSQLKAIYAPVQIKTGFNVIHREAIAALVSDTASAFGESIAGVKRNAKQFMSQATKDVLTQQLAKGQISGDALRSIKKQLMGTLQEQGLNALVDKGGNGWSLDRYTEMLIRTKTVEARNMGLKNRMVENGYDLVQVSSHGADDVCGDWEGKILSLTGETKELDGEDVPTVDEAEGEGLFHPNCKHAINALTLDLARDTMGWNADTGEYEEGLIE